ncbi:helix-turn-helix domain-containing protein [Solirubrobacter sp. CPCC 204708]|uniref:Helix-turn-helix domain-containing protein n=1 Tax=Solirubrobacter deserti TaxID=2282478 RepID=A0ABT4RCC3_9ACTN|nr:helix-turn-helix domain-containing protein [Solirubrobacter deserti]MBE2315546.1 helix-turn-helix domain-containing protein [Solirubrobacter deserti]MDA0136184.1 helix-turn-helix domain-containing protein [Solirubrobacter deserti]
MRRSSILTRETAPAVAAWLEGLGLQRARDLVDLPENEALGMTQRVVLPIRHGDVLLGFLWVIVGERPLTEADRAAIARGGAEVADNLWGRLREADERRGRINALLARAFGGEAVGAELAATLRWPATGSFAVVVSSGGDEIPERLRRRRGAADYAWLALQERVVIVARDPTAALPDELATAGARGGLARFPGLADIPEALHHAELAALCARAAPDLGPVAVWGELGSWGLVADLWVSAGRPLPISPLLELTMHRRRDQLLEALTVFLESGGDAAAAAKTLHLHRASLYRRIERVEQITGLDLSRGDDRLLAHLGLRLLRLHDAFS